MARPEKLSPGIGERLGELRGQNSRDTFAEKLGVHKNTIGNYERGDRQPEITFLQSLHERLDVNLNWLLTGDGAPYEEHGEFAHSTEQIALPRYSVQASAGGGALVLSQEVNGTFTVGRDWLSRYVPPGAKTGIIEARGDSMEPTIFDGDILLLNFSIDRSAVDGGGVFVITVDGSLLVKRLQVTLDGHVLVLSDNDNYETEKVTREYADERMIVHAQVVWSGGPIRRR